MLINLIDFRLKYPIVLIGLLHLCLVIFRVYEVAFDIYMLRDLFGINQIIYLSAIILFQLLMICSLYIGVCKENNYFILPWLFFTAPVLVMATSCAFNYIQSGDHKQTVVNFFVIAILWSAWYTTLKHCLNLREKIISHLDYKYSKLDKEPFTMVV